MSQADVKLSISLRVTWTAYFPDSTTRVTGTHARFLWSAGNIGIESRVSHLLDKWGHILVLWMRTVPQRPKNLNTWFPIGGAIWGQGLGVYSLALLPVHYLHLVCNWKHHLFASCSNSLLYASPSTGDLPLIFSPTHQEPSAIIDVFIHKLLYSHGVFFFIMTTKRSSYTKWAAALDPGLPDENNKHIGLGLIPLASFQHFTLSQITSIKSLSPVKVLTKGLNFSPSIYTLWESTMPSIVCEAASLDLIFLLFQFVLHKCFN